MSAGYSGTPLPKKLGLKEGSRVRFWNDPDSFANLLEPLPAGVEPSADGVDVAVLFCRSETDLVRDLDAAIHCLAPRGGLWIAWPKRTSGVATDLTEDRLREIILPMGLVDNKVCAIDATWSGLRFVWRLKKD